MSFLVETIIYHSRVNLENANSWIGPYQEAAKNVHFKHLDKRCGCCFQNFLPVDQTIIFPCTHGLHERCFRSWNKPICPFDRTLVEGAQKASFLGYSIFFSLRTQKFGLWLANHQVQINSAIEVFIKKFAYENPGKFQKCFLENTEENRELRDFGNIIQAVLQDALDAYDGKLSIENIPKKIDKLSRDLERLPVNKIDVWKYREMFGRKHLECAKIIELGVDLEELSNLIHITLKRNSSEPDGPAITFKTEQVIFFFKRYTGLNIETEGAKRFNQYISSLLNTLITNPAFPFLEGAIGFQIFKSHFKAIKQLPTDKERCLYLSKMNNQSLANLYRRTQSKGPTFLLIKQNIEKIITYRERIHSVKNHAKLFIATVVTVALFLRLLVFFEDNMLRKI